jgi:hypothetical protein
MSGRHKKTGRENSQKSARTSHDERFARKRLEPGFRLLGHVAYGRRSLCPVGPPAARITGPILRRSIWIDFVGDVASGLDSGCEVCAGLLIPVAAIAAQVNNAARMILAVGFACALRLSRSRSGFGFGVNGITFFLAPLRLDFRLIGIRGGGFDAS